MAAGVDRLTSTPASYMAFWVSGVFMILATSLFRRLTM
jgi:hypothetical protein